MSWYFRRSRKYGPFRVTISSSGISSSIGFGGVRVTSSKRGTYFSASPGGGLRFRQRLDTPVRQPPSSPVYVDPTSMQEIASENAAHMVDHGEILERISANERRGDWLPWVAIAVAAGLVYVFAESGAAIGVGCILLSFALRAYLKKLSPVELDYQLNADEARQHETLKNALAALERSKKVWQVNAVGNTSDWKRNAGANQLIKRTTSSLGRGTAPTFRANVEVFHLKLKGETLYFLPDMLFVQQRTVFGSVSYPNLTVADALTSFREAEGVPSDAQQIGLTWRFVNKNGGPDRRFNNNRQIPIAQYGEIAMQSESGLRVALMISNVEATRAFAAGMRNIQLKPETMQYLSLPEPAT